MKVYTIGFTKTTAERFFERLKTANIRSLIDVRLNNVSQLAGFAKKDDLRYFTQQIVKATYAHKQELAPTQQLLDAYKKQGASWDEYAKQFTALMQSRQIERTIGPDEIDAACLLCSEDTAHQCHRRLVVEYLRDKWGGLEIVHL